MGQKYVSRLKTYKTLVTPRVTRDATPAPMMAYDAFIRISVAPRDTPKIPKIFSYDINIFIKIKTSKDIRYF